MVVCLCAGLNESEIEAALDAGAETLAEIGQTCGAGLDCRGCHATLEEMLCKRSCEGCPGGNSLAGVSCDSGPGGERQAGGAAL
jgi:bacterioferritin-associated ferredoxin